ncbi:MAG: type II toxin-antitoxin system RelE/ParE family toxin [Phycisphaeraceae bacterium]
MPPKPDPLSNVVYDKGPACSIVYAIDAKGNMPAYEFYEGRKSELTKQQRRKFFSYFARMGDVGRITNTDQFNSERNGIYAFKIWKQRIYCFQDGNEWVLTHGCKKNQQKADPNELDRAERIRKEHLARKPKV